MKHEFSVADMTCGHCVKTITQAIQSKWPDAIVVADTATHHLSVETDAQTQDIMVVLQAEGYTPQAI